ncbi:MAG: DUF5752 family protein [Chlamydiales bacterium]|nr:DUF5752 family protein [Chlamydiales bacterium]
MASSFFLKDCALIGVSTGESVTSLLQFKEVIAKIPLSSIYHHFWGGRLRPSFIHPDYHNDFAYWAHFSLHDNILSERLGIIDPREHNDLEDLRKTLIEIIETRLDEKEFILWTKQEQKFYFTRSVIVVFDTPLVVNHPSELKNIIPLLPTSSIFYHFIDARTRTPEKEDDFTYWIKESGEDYQELLGKIALIDHYFLSLPEIKTKLIEIFTKEWS